MALEDYYDLSHLKNHTEESVYIELEKQLVDIPDEDICKCNTCIVDMACLALNGLPARYRASLMGTIYSRAQDEAFEEKVKSMVAQAIAKISINPGHQ